MRRFPYTPTLSWLSALGIAAAALLTPALVRADASLALQMGCLNCHGTLPRGDAPSFQRMQQRAGQGERSPDERAAHWLEEMRAAGSGWHAIVGHRQVTDDTARALTQWLSRPETRAVN